MVKRRVIKTVDKEVLTGRPKLQDSNILTPEMENVAQLSRAGYEPEYIAQELDISLDKVMMYLIDTAIVRNRIRELFGDNLKRFSNLRDSLFEWTMRYALKEIMQSMRTDDATKKVALERVDKWMQRYDPFEGPTGLKVERMVSEKEEEVIIKKEDNNLFSYEEKGNEEEIKEE